MPSKQDSLAFLRLSAVLLRLSSLVYDVDESHVGQRVGLDVPLAGKEGESVPIRATLVEFRYCSCSETKTSRHVSMFCSGDTLS